MATVTKTLTENITYYPSAGNWVVTVSHADMTVSASTFKWTAPTITAKYTATNRGHAYLYVGVVTLGTASSSWGWAEYGSETASVTLATNTAKTIPFAHDYGLTTDNVQTSRLFNSSNRASKTVSIQCDLNNLKLQSWNTDGTRYGSLRDDITLSSVFKVTLNAPPTVTYDNPTYSNPQYAGLGSYSIDVTEAKAQYQGYVSSITLTVGTDSVTQTYSATTVTNKTISVIPTVGGTYTPTLKVTDSRGQTTTASLPQITVNPYNAPSLDFDVFRTNSSGVRDDEGAYGLITANISFTDAVADINEPTVQINGTTTSNVTWYSAYNASTGVSGAISDWSTISDGDTIYGLINGSFSQTDSYQITVTLEDSLGGTSSAITQTLSTAFYTIDFQAGGKEISFGGPANDNLTSYPNGLFKCNMDALLAGSTTEVENPYYSLDTTASPGTTDGDLYAAITDLSWQSDVIVSNMLDDKALLTKIMSKLPTLVVEVVNSNSVNINANSASESSFSVAKSGYTPLGIVGYNIAGTGISAVAPYRMRVIGSTAYYGVRNYGTGRATDVIVQASVLYVKWGS